MIDKVLSKIEIEDLQRLIDNGVGESKTIEYKAELHIDTGDEKKEFLADVSSFANALGGDLIYGIKEDRDTNLPSEITGISIKSDDGLIRKIESMLRDAIAPRIPDIAFQPIQLHDDLNVLIIRITASFLAPHRVIYNGHDKFYTRNSKGKYQMDVNELRSAFNMSLELSKRIEDYKTERLSIIIANKYKMLSEDSPIFALHFLPISAFLRRELKSIKEIMSALEAAGVSAFDQAYDKQIIVDGVLINGYVPYRISANCDAPPYRSAFARFNVNGIIEHATTCFFDADCNYGGVMPSSTIKRIFSKDLIEKTINVTKQCLDYFHDLNIPTPIILSCAILNGAGFTIPRDGLPRTKGEIDRDELLISDVMIEDLSISPEKCLKPIFDSIWNACGYTRCLAYNEQDEFIGLKG